MSYIHVKSSPSLIIKKMWIKIIMRYLYKLIRLTKIEQKYKHDLTVSMLGKDPEQLDSQKFFFPVLIQHWQACKIMWPLWKSWQLLINISIYLEYYPGIPTPQLLSKRNENIYSSPTHNLSKLETLQMPFNWWIDKLIKFIQWQHSNRKNYFYIHDT